MDLFFSFASTITHRCAGRSIFIFSKYSLYTLESMIKKDPLLSSLLKDIESGVRKVNAKGKYAGGFVAQSKDDIKCLLDMGMRFITYEVDSSIVYKAVNDIADWFEKEST